MVENQIWTLSKVFHFYAGCAIAILEYSRRTWTEFHCGCIPTVSIVIVQWQCMHTAGA